MRPGHLRAVPLAAAAVLSLASTLHAQTVDDHVMMPRGNLCAVLSYAHESWDEYWEGELKRVNGNIGTVTTESFGPSAAYGITNRLNVIAMLPYVKTHASQGVLHGMSGWQDLTVALKFNALETPFTSHGALRTIVVVSGGTPVSDYTPDFLPLSIGSHSRSLSGRLTVGFQANAGWFLEGSGAYTRRGDVTLDRSAYYTNGQLFLGDQVSMPDVFDYKFAAGYLKHGFYAPVYFQQRITRGGGDIRRQDAPFVSNKMNASRVGAFVQYSLPMVRKLAVKLEGAYTVDGRNVGQATTVTGALLYTFHF